MSQAILTSSAILAYVLLTQYGRRMFSWRTWLPAVIGIPVAAAVYLSRAPAHRYDIYLYLVAAGACGFTSLKSWCCCAATATPCSMIPLWPTWTSS